MRNPIDKLLDWIATRRTPGLRPRRSPLQSGPRQRFADWRGDVGDRWRERRGNLPRWVWVPAIVAALALLVGGALLGNSVGEDPNAQASTTTTVQHFITVPNPSGPGSVTIPVTKKVTRIKYKNKTITVRIKGGKAVISSPGTTITQTSPGRTVTDTRTDTKTDTRTSTQISTKTNTQTDTTTVIHTTTTTVPGTNITVTTTVTVTGPTQTVTTTEISGTTITVTVTAPPGTT